MGELTRQEMQSMFDQLRVRIQDIVSSRQDVQRCVDNSRDRVISYMHDYLQQNQQQFIRQLDERTRIYKGQVASLESRIQSLESEVRASHQMLAAMAQKQQSVVIPGVQEAVQNQQNYRFAQTS